MTITEHSNSYCEAWVNDNWIRVPVRTGINNPDITVRCLECHGPVVLMRAGRNNTTRPHAEHRPGHSGCSIGHYFNGKKLPHPQQVMAPSSPTSTSLENEIVLEDDESTFPEGKEKFKLHRYRERDAKIVKRAKAKRLEETGKLQCEVCQFDFLSHYGDIGYGFIEAHHKVPVSQLDGSKKTKIQDLAMVCSNCHRMLHRGGSSSTVEKLKDIYLENDA